MKRTKIQFGKIQLNAGPKEPAPSSSSGNNSAAGFGTFGSSPITKHVPKAKQPFATTPIAFDAEDHATEDTKEMAAVMGISSFGRKAQSFDIIVRADTEMNDHILDKTYLNNIISFFIHAGTNRQGERKGACSSEITGNR